MRFISVHQIVLIIRNVMIIIIFTKVFDKCIFKLLQITEDKVTNHQQKRPKKIVPKAELPHPVYACIMEVLTLVHTVHVYGNQHMNFRKTQPNVENTDTNGMCECAFKREP